MVMGPGKTLGIDKTKLRLAMLALLIVVMFVALFSRLWYLQVLATDEYKLLAKENRVRRVHSEPERGEILDRNGVVLVDNRLSPSVTIDRQLLDKPQKVTRVLKRLAGLLDVKVSDMRARLEDTAESPYKPVAVANDVPEDAVFKISELHDRFPGVAVEKLPVREYPHGSLAAHALGYVAEISPQELRSDYFKDARPRYAPADLVGKFGVEYAYDQYLRGRPRVEKKIVNSLGDVIDSDTIQLEQEGHNLVLSLDVRIQKLVESALANGLDAARAAHFAAPAGAAVVMDPNTGGVIAMASLPDYDPSILADGITEKEFASLGRATPDDPDDDAFLNRAIQAQRQPGSTFKVVTAGAAMATGIADPYTQLECPGSKIYPPEGGPGSVTFRNWTSLNQGYLTFPESLEQSCDTFYYELGWRMEDAFGVGTLNGDGTERFQKYERTAGFGHPTGVDLRYEASGRVPDNAWCKADDQVEGVPSGLCPEGWLPGYTVNMAIGQGDLIVTPMQMAVTYAAIANGGKVLQPRLGWEITDQDETGTVHTEQTFPTKVVKLLPLDDTELAAIENGLVDVMGGGEGTARAAFAGFPLDEIPLAGKTGTAQVGDIDLNINDAWFVSYGPVGSPEYVIAVYVEKAGHGGESAAPIARQIWEGIYDLDEATTVHLGSDSST